MKRTRLPEDFEVSPRIIELALKNHWPDPHKEVDAFRDYHLARGSLFVNWEAAFRTWLRNAAKWGKTHQVRTIDPRPIRRREDRPKEETRHDPQVRALLSSLINKLSMSEK